MFQEKKTFPGITLCKLVEKGITRTGPVASQTKHGSLITNKAHTFNDESD